TPREAFIAEDVGGGGLADRLERLFAPARVASLEVTAYPPVHSLPVQAAPALVQLYARTVSGALEALREPLGAEATVRLFEEARARAGVKHAALASYRVGPEGGVEGESVAEAEALTDAVAAWLLEALTTASRVAEDIDPAALLERVTYENRLALEAQGFFRHLPWPVGRCGSRAPPRAPGRAGPAGRRAAGRSGSHLRPRRQPERTRGRGPAWRKSMARLYIVSTPIGNLGDFTYRAVEVLGRVGRILAEDTRRTAVLLRHYGISTPLVSAHEHNEAARARQVIDWLDGGEDVALVSDAGTPLVSDPG